MKKHGHYCKVCGEYKANEKFSGKGHAAHICKKCAALPADVRSAQMIENKLLSLPWRLSKEQIKWLNNKAHDKRPEIRELAQEQLDMRFHPERLVFLLSVFGHRKSRIPFQISCLLCRWGRRVFSNTFT